jgi:hypothetical protein
VGRCTKEESRWAATEFGLNKQCHYCELNSSRGRIRSLPDRTCLSGRLDGIANWDSELILMCVKNCEFESDLSLPARLLLLDSAKIIWAWETTVFCTLLMNRSISRQLIA